MHRLLRRQLRRLFGDSPTVPEEWQGFVDAVDQAYEQFDEDHNLLERSLELSSQELLEANQAKTGFLQEAEAREREAHQLQEVTAQLAASHDMNSVLDLIVQRAAGLLGSEASSLFSYDEEKGGLVFTRGHNFLTHDAASPSICIHTYCRTCKTSWQEPWLIC